MLMKNIKKLITAEMFAVTGGQSCPPWPKLTLTEEQKHSMVLDAQLAEILEESRFYYENMDWFE